MIALDQVEGTRRLNFRASATPGAIVWSQPEANSGLYYDVTNIYFRGCSTVTFDSASTIRFNKFPNAVALGTDTSGNLKKTSLSSVATSGSYNDLSNKPTIPSKVSQLTNDSSFATTTQLGSKQDKNIVLDTLGSTTVEGALKSIKDTADIAISTATNAKETANNCNDRLGTAESTLISVKANQDFILKGGKEVNIDRDLTDSLVLTSTELNNIKDNVLSNPFFTARFKANNLYYTVIFHRKSWFNTSNSAPIYLFEGMYASTSAIFKVYLVFGWGNSFTQKAIKVEKYASIA